RVGEFRGQLHSAPIPPYPTVSRVALFLPGPDADRLPATLILSGRVPVMLYSLVAGIGAKAPQSRHIHVARRLRRRQPAERSQHLRRVAVIERQDALFRMDIARVIIEAQLDALAVQPVHELLRMRYQWTPVVAALPAVVVPGEVQHQRVEGNLTLAQP